MLIACYKLKGIKYKGTNTFRDLIKVTLYLPNKKINLFAMQLFKLFRRSGIKHTQFI